MKTVQHKQRTHAEGNHEEEVERGATTKSLSISSYALFAGKIAE